MVLGIPIDEKGPLDKGNKKKQG
jgi:hypothetical protein